MELIAVPLLLKYVYYNVENGKRYNVLESLRNVLQNFYFF